MITASAKERARRRILVLALGVLAVAGCSGDEGDGGEETAQAVQQQLQDAGIACDGRVEPSAGGSDDASTGMNPVSTVECDNGSATIEINEWNDASGRSAAMDAGASLICGFGVERFSFVATGPVAVAATDAGGENVDLELNERIGEALGVEPTVIECADQEE